MDNRYHIEMELSHKWLIILPVVLGCILFVFLSPLLLYVGETKFDEFALGTENTSYFARVQGYPIHCMYIEDIEQCIKGWELRGKNPVVLWLGNSQLHAINQMKEGDENAAPIVFRRLASKKVDFVTVSLPNVNFQEHYVLFRYLAHKMNIKVLILAAVFDDTRETGIRDEIASVLCEPEQIEDMQTTAIGSLILQENQGKKSVNNDIAGLRDTVQESVEKSINEWLSYQFEFWNMRALMRGHIFIKLYQLRNTVLNISPQSKRPIIPGRYAKNIKAFDKILQSAVYDGVKAIAYVAPLRNDIDTPYIEDEYELFKQDIHEITLKNGSYFVNLENLVPGELWGENNSTSLDGEGELDFMHFQAGGHKVLANKIIELVDEYGL